MKHLVGALCAMAACGCASHSGVIPAGGGELSITKQAATGFSGLGNMKAEVLQEASAYCKKEGKTMSIVNYQETKGPYILGNYPRVDLTFRCAD